MSESTITITTPTPPEEVARMGPLEQTISSLKIVDAATHAEAKKYGKRLTGMKRFILELYAEPKKKADEAHKSITTMERKYLEPIDKTLSLLNGRIDIYERAEKARAEEEARQRQIEANRIEQERALQEAVAAEQAGDIELAEAIIEVPPAPAVVLPEPNLAKVAGTSARTSWSGEGINLLATVKFVAEHPEFIDCLAYNQTGINGHARAMKGNLKIPGVRAVESTIRSYRD